MTHFAYTNSTAYLEYIRSPQFLAELLIALVVFSIISYIIVAFLLGRIFKKAGLPQWAAWVPVYNFWKTLELGNQQGFWALIALIPYAGIVGIIFLYIATYHIGKKLGKEDWFVLVAIFIPVLWLIWLGFDDSKWLSKHKSITTPTAT